MTKAKKTTSVLTRGQRLLPVPESKFKIDDHIRFKDTGRYGTVVSVKKHSYIYGYIYKVLDATTGFSLFYNEGSLYKVLVSEFKSRTRPDTALLAKKPAKANTKARR